MTHGYNNSCFSSADEKQSSEAVKISSKQLWDDSPRHGLHNRFDTLLNVGVQRVYVIKQARLLPTCCHKVGPDVLAVANQYDKALIACMQR